LKIFIYKHTETVSMEKSSEKTSSLAITSLVLGIVSIPLLFLWGIGTLFGIAALVLGIIALNRINKTKSSGKGMAIAGIATGGFTLLVALILVIVIIAYYAMSTLTAGSLA
jgi:hypothetical protein